MEEEKTLTLKSLEKTSKRTVRLHGHLTVSDFGGVIKDIFDCSHEIVDEFWVVK